jgi:penicillin-binding protein 1A
MTTAVWYGRDDSRRIPGLAGGKNPAAAFNDFMKAALANRPAEELVTEVAAPEWQTEEPIAPIPVDEDAIINQEGDGLPADDSRPYDEPVVIEPRRAPRADEAGEPRERKPPPPVRIGPPPSVTRPPPLEPEGVPEDEPLEDY